MAGWETLKAIRLLESRVDALGLEMVYPRDRSGNNYPGIMAADRIALQPKGDSLPHYSRDAYIWEGSLEELRHWLDGIDWAWQYDAMLKISSHKTRNKAESDERNRQLMATIKKSKLVQGGNKGLIKVELVKEAYDEESPF